MSSSGPRRPASQQAAAEYLGVHTNTIRRYVAKGVITGYRIGPRLIRVDLDEIDALLSPIPTVGTIGTSR